MLQPVRRILPYLIGLGLLGPAMALRAAENPPGSVIIGNVTCFRLRAPDGDQSVQQRINHLQDVAAKHLGGGPVHFQARSVGPRRHIDVNGDFLVAVTPADAAATGYKTAAALAPVWQRALERAFRHTRARPAPPADTAPQSEGK
jgi:hypothetical protein